MDQKDAASGPTPRHGQGVLDYPPISELDLNSDIQGGGARLARSFGGTAATSVTKSLSLP